ncbi:hypothetical protein [Prescottella subtropica]|uniref:hypothetical protein n=1 Tax=Prescottella subtropica TaxID=2545757 RepID=UPI0010F6BB2B|nr:hypothetical protein [Prescottella subtropica]
MVFFGTGIWLIVELIRVFVNGEWSRAVITPGLFVFGSLMVAALIPDDTSGDLTDEDLPHIDRAIEHITLPYNSQEYRLAEYAADLTQRIADSPAWASNFLTKHRIELDYTQELREIVTHAHTLRSIRTELGEPPTGNSHDALRARDHFEKIAAPLDVVWLALVERVAALESFTLHLAALDTQLANMKAVGRATLLEDKIGGLLANAVSDEFAAEHTRSVTERSQYASLSIESTLDALRGDIAGLTALAQSLPATYEAN